jgi:hypothetical protein
MEMLARAVDPSYLMIAGVVGILLGTLFLVVFCYRRIRWLILVLARKGPQSPGAWASLRNAVGIALWGSLFGMLLFFGFFLRTYHAFTYEEPVAEVRTQRLGERHGDELVLIHYISRQRRTERYLMVQGDQWVIEGDILKWEDWLNFVGLHTRYRLTRLRGRYLNTRMERQKGTSVYSLVEREDNVGWSYLYRYGQQLPFVNTVYGSAAFQLSGSQERYLVYVSASGLVVRKAE